MIFVGGKIPGVLKAVPPVSLRSIWYGLAMVKSGHALAGFGAVELLVAPFAIAFERDGLLLVMKLPHMVINAFSKSGPKFGVAGPK